jgi:hypothetical protein
MPPRRFIVDCAECGKMNLFERSDMLGEDPLYCKYCKTALTEAAHAKLQPVFCNYSGLWCGYPCGKSVEDWDGGPKTCTYNTPLSQVPYIDSASYVG